MGKLRHGEVNLPRADTYWALTLCQASHVYFLTEISQVPWKGRFFFFNLYFTYEEWNPGRSFFRGHRASKSRVEIWSQAKLTSRLGRLSFTEDTIFFLFIYFSLRWVLVAVRGLSLVALSRGYSSLQCAGFSLRWLLLLWSMGSRRTGAVVVACGL